MKQRWGCAMLTHDGQKVSIEFTLEITDASADERATWRGVDSVGAAVREMGDKFKFLLDHEDFEAFGRKVVRG